MIRREVSGPQAQYERTGAEGFRDVRPTTKRLREALASSASGLILMAAGGASWFYPAAVELTVPVGVLYAAWVLTRRVVLPLRLPKSAKRKDWNYPDPKDRKPRQSAGTVNIGKDAFTGQELWLSNEDMRQHTSVPGTTGAGKTTAILSLLANPLAHGSGFVFVDGKAQNQLYGEVLALARRFGREDDVLVINFMVASGSRDSARFNPFSTGNADALREMIVSQLGEASRDDQNGVFRANAVYLIGTLAPVLIWMRDTKGIPLNIDVIRRATELPWIWLAAKKKVLRIANPETGKDAEVAAADMPESLVWSLLRYLGELPGYDPEVPITEQRSDKPSEQHGYSVRYFTSVFQQLGGSLGHIFRAEAGDVDMRDVILNRRILVVNLPALENSDDSLAALGRIVVASVRGMMAQMLGTRLEGPSEEIFALKAGSGDAPFHVVFDEVAYYATSGMDRMLAMGRGLNIAFWLGFQEISGVWERIGEKTRSLLGNANLTLAMRQQDADRTRDWIEKTAGQSSVTQATTFHGGGVGQYREAQHAEVKQISRVDWRDLQTLIEGEAIVLFAGRRVYAKLFHAAIDVTGPIRMNRPLLLVPPSSATLRSEQDAIAQIVDCLLSGRASIGAEPERPVLTALLDGVAEALKNPETLGAGVVRAFHRAEMAQVDVARAQHAAGIPQHAEPPVTDLLPMLEEACAAARRNDDDPGVPSNPINAEAMRALMAIETVATGSPAMGRRQALAALAERDRAVESLRWQIHAPGTTPEQLASRIDALCDKLAA